MSVTICDVGPRDGLQNDPKTLPPETRAELVNRLAAAGVPRIEAVSFVNPARVPQMAGAEEVVAAIDREPGTVYAGLAPERARLRPARGDGPRRGALRVRRDRDVQPAELERLGGGVARGRRGASSTRAHADGIRATVTIGAAFGCPFEGQVDPGRILELAGALAEAGADELVFADTIGVGVPRQVRRLVGEGVALGKPVAVHLHNTRNTGIANAFAAVEAGASVLDASVGGIGGCPFAPRATGNICTEDLVYLLHGEGIETGIDLDGLIAVAEWLEGVLGRQLEGQVYRAGTFAPVAG